MYTLLLIFILTQALGIYRGIVREESLWNYNWLNRYVRYILLFFVLSIITILIIHLNTEHEYKIETKVQYLQNMNDGNGSEGTFGLFGGSIDNKLMFRYYIKSGNAYYYKQMDASGVPVVYSNSNPRIEKKYKVDVGEYNWDFKSAKKKISTIIYVPKGSVKREFNFDAK